jgi:hypothetical protein
MSVGQLASETIRAAQSGWSPERVAAAGRAAVYAVATAHRLGREELVEIRIAAETEDDRDPVVQLARWFDRSTYPPETAPLPVAEALAQLDDLDFEPKVVEAFRAVQPVIQPVGLE